MKDNLKIIKKEVEKLLKNDNSGHGMEHINRVVNIASKITEKEKADKELVIAIALLHDIDDYKLFGNENSLNLTNTSRILNETSISLDDKEIIKNSIKTIGYSKRLDGIKPEILEAKIVSDADMLDCMGVFGILRTFQYNMEHNNPFFDRKTFPILDMDSTTYKQKKNGTVINHIFEKILKLKKLMLTDFGKSEAIKRYNFTIEFLKEYFYEEDANEWEKYLNDYINNN